ncbi:MAG: hypothetical protein HFI21_01055 [Lachnospiraceae bacterium]|nr:hypothetical protein [Lachnospiraceae bacterium]
MQNLNNKFKSLPWLCILGSTFALIAYFVFFPSRNDFNSDYADSLYWAKAAYDAKSFFDPDFIYACTLPFGGQWFFLPFIGIFGVSMEAQILGMSLFLFVFTLTLFFLFKAMGYSTKESCLYCSFLLLILSSSGKLREILWCHILYYSCGILGIQIGFLLFLWHQKLYEKNSRRKWFCFILLCIWLFLCASNGNSVMPLTIFPLFVGLAGERILHPEPLSIKKKPDFWFFLLILFFVSIIGYLWGTNLSASYPSEYADSYLVYSDIQNWPDNLLRLFPSWLTLLGVTPAAGDAIISAAGLGFALKICISILLSIIPLFMLLYYSKINSRPIRMYILIHWSLAAVLLFGWLFGDLSNSNWRLSPLIYTSAIMTALFFHWVFKEQYRLIIKRLGCISAFVSGCTCLLIFSQIAALPSDYQSVNPKYALAALLKEMDLTYGYAEFWEAAALTVISGSDVQVRSIIINDDFYHIYLYQTNTDWYKEQENVERYFVAVSTSQYEHLSSIQHFLVVTADETYISGPYTILVYDHNLFSD